MGPDETEKVAETGIFPSDDPDYCFHCIIETALCHRRLCRHWPVDYHRVCTSVGHFQAETASVRRPISINEGRETDWQSQSVSPVLVIQLFFYGRSYFDITVQPIVENAVKYGAT